MSNLKVTIDDDACAFLEKHESSLTLRASPRHGCCGGTVFLPVAEAGIPRDSENWASVEHNAIRIYIEPGLDIPDNTHIRVGLDKLLMFNHLWVEGLTPSM